MSKLLEILKALLRALTSTDRQPTPYERLSPCELADLPSFHEPRAC
jgi:hypothetical protein